MFFLFRLLVAFSCVLMFCVVLFYPYVCIAVFIMISYYLIVSESLGIFLLLQGMVLYFYVCTLYLKDVVDAVLGCRPVSSRLISIRLRAAPFNITIIQVYAPTSGHDDREVDHFYQQLQETIDQTPKKDILVVQGDWNAKVGKDAQAD